MFDINGIPLDDPQGRWEIDTSGTTFGTGVSKDANRLSSVEDGDLDTPPYRTDGPQQTLAVTVTPSSPADLTAYLDAVRALFNLSSIEIGRTIAGERRIVTARLETIGETSNSALRSTLQGVFRVPRVYWRAEGPAELVVAASPATLIELKGLSAPVIDAQILVQGPVTSFYMTDVESRSHIGWTGSVAAGRFLRIDVGTMTAVDQADQGWWSGGTDVSGALTTVASQGRKLRLSPLITDDPLNRVVQVEYSKSAGAGAVKMLARKAFL